MGTVIGIDLGTTKSVVGAWIDGKPVIIPDSIGRLSIPSEILIQGEIEHQEVFVGWESRTKNKYQDNSFVVFAIKRMMGKTNLNREKWWYEYPQYTISYILAELKCMAEEYLNQDITDAIITIPSHFDLNQRRATLEAAKIAGLNVISLLNEATASALTYFSSHPEEQKIAVLDIGGGTTDISVISWGENVCEVIAVDGSTEIGGIDFSNLIYEWYLLRLKEKYNILSTNITKTVEVLIRDQIETVKKELSDNKICKIHLPYIEINGSFLEEEFALTQNEFERISRKIIDQIIRLIKDIINQHNITSLLLLGGASNTYGIKERILKELSYTPSKRVNTETSVAIGAIIKSASINKFSKTLVIDCLQDNYGIGLKDNVYEPLLYKNETIPRSISKEFTTTQDNQTSLSINVYKGQKPSTSGNTFLGSLEITDIPPALKGVPVIIVKFDVNSNMDISVSAQIKGNEIYIVKSVLKSQNGIPEKLLNDMSNKVSFWISKRKMRVL